MILRIACLASTTLVCVTACMADMAPPSPTPNGTGGINSGVHDVSHTLTPLGWFAVVVTTISAVVLVIVGVLRARGNEKQR